MVSLTFVSMQQSRRVFVFKRIISALLILYTSLLGKEPYQGTFGLILCDLSILSFMTSTISIHILAGQSKHLEAYDSGCSTGDMEYALTNLFLYSNTGIYGCGDNLKSACQNARCESTSRLLCSM
jgi:hypothetical protein